MCTLRVFRPVFLAVLFVVFSSASVFAEQSVFYTEGSPEIVDKLVHAVYASELGVREVVSLDLPSRDGSVRIELESHDIRSVNYRAELSGPNGKYADPAEVFLFRGTATQKGAADFARFGVITDAETDNSKLYGYFRANGVYYSVEPEENALLIEALSLSDLQALIAACGLDGIGHTLFGDSEEDWELRLQSLKEAEVATEADYEFTQAEANPNARILTILNGVDAIYEDELRVSLTVTYQNAWTRSNDPYTKSDAGDLLDEFVDYWNLNVSESFDVAHLWTGKDLDNSVVGIAYVGAVCTSHAYGLSQRLSSNSYNIPLTAHEMGHNFGAGHDTCQGSDRWIMCPRLVSNANEFSSESSSAIASYVNTVSCLSRVEDTPDENSRPVLDSIGSQSVNEGETLSFSVSATDPDGDTLAFSTGTLPDGATFASPNFSYTPQIGTVPDGSSSTTKTATFIVSDPDGLTDSETVTISVFVDNQAPQFGSIETQSVDEGSLFAYQLSASDADGDVLTYSASSLPYGATINSSNGIISWRPGGNQDGTYNISVSVSDSEGGSDSATLTVVVQNVDGIADYPTTHVLGDFDGSGQADVSVYRAATGTWYWDDISGSSSGSFESASFGLIGDVPVPGDYNGDKITDVAVFRPSTSVWYVRYSGSGIDTIVGFGAEGDIPCPHDYDGDGRYDIAVFRPSVGSFLYRKSSDENSTVTVSLGQSADIPVPCDYDGDGLSDAAVYRPEDGTWRVMLSDAESVTSVGERADIPVPGDYNGDGTCEMAYWRPSEGNWYLSSSSSAIQFGLGGDVPVPADVDGDGDTDIAVWRPSAALWYIREDDGSATAYQLGLPTDIVASRESTYYAFRNSPLSGPEARSTDEGNAFLYRSSESKLYCVGSSGPTQAAISAPIGSYIVRGDYNADSNIDTAVYYAGWWMFYLSGEAAVTSLWGEGADEPVSGDFDGDGETDIAVFRPDSGGGFSSWYIIRSSDSSAAVYNWGIYGDQPIPADYNGDGWTDIAVWRPSLGGWYVLDARSGMPLQAVQWGLYGDDPRAADFDGDGRADKVIWRPGEGNWYSLESSGATGIVQWGLFGDTPVPGEYLADGEVSYAVYRPSTATLYVRARSGATTSYSTGLLASDQLVGFQPYEAVR